jgi:hypothetical protein
MQVWVTGVRVASDPPPILNTTSAITWNGKIFDVIKGTEQAASTFCICYITSEVMSDRQFAQRYPRRQSR